MRPWIIIAALVTVVGSAVPAAAATSGEPVRIDTMLSLTGAAAFLGQSEAKTLAALETALNTNENGINGRPVKFVVVDDGSQPANAVQNFNAIVARKAQVVLGPGYTATCNAVNPLATNGPVTYCLSPSINPAGYAFAGNVWPEQLAHVMLRYFRDRNWHKIALITSTDASGTEFVGALNNALALPENASMKLVAAERFALSDVSVAGQMARIKAAAPDILMTWTVGTGLGIVLHGIADSGITTPVSGCSCNMILAQLNSLASIMPKEIYFPAVRGLVEGAVAKGPLRDAQSFYFATIRSAGLPADMTSNIPWDPALLIVDSLRHVGPDASAAQIRDYLANSHGYVGINALYDFRDRSNRGIGENGAAIVRWDATAQKFIVVSKAGGHI
jgi:branched-chain amino acid transport system substrate-binding protein